MTERYAVYILTNRTSKVLYVGVTGNLEQRIWQHRTKAHQGFTARYNIGKLVYVEYFADVTMAIAREKQIKGWSRAKKLALVANGNPKWNDLAEDWYSQADRGFDV